jgi:hypothetical protein
MPEIIKTWPAFMDPKKVAQIFGPHPPFGEYYFTLGRGKPQQEVTKLWFTYRGRILGCFPIHRVWRNDGSLPPLRRLDGEESDWQLKPDAWIAVCNPQFEKLRARVYFGGFRGWRYFDLSAHRGTMESKVRL